MFFLFFLLIFSENFATEHGIQVTRQTVTMINGKGFEVAPGSRTSDIQRFPCSRDDDSHDSDEGDRGDTEALQDFVVNSKHSHSAHPHHRGRQRTQSVAPNPAHAARILAAWAGCGSARRR